MNYPFKRAIIDIRNYIFLRKTIKKNIETVEWKKYNLRHDWIGRIYTVVNLTPEVVPDVPDPPEEAIVVGREPEYLAAFCTAVV